MKYILALAFFISLSFAQQEKLVIDANSFEADDKRGISVFTGNVKLKMGNDRLNANKLEIYVDTKSKSKSKTPTKYIATGAVDFEIHSKGKIFIGNGNRVIYNPSKQEYTVIGKGYIKEKVEQREIYADKIFINQLTGSARVSGSEDKPVRFILNIDNSGKQQ
ncbi:MAG: LptA/OstA family protein [Halarcobacter sp.]